MKIRHKKIMKKFLVLSAIAAILLLNLSSYVSAKSLAEVSVFKNVDVQASLGDVTGTGPYTLDLKLDATDLANVDLINPNQTVVFYAKELSDKWDKDGTAHVTSELLPITLEDLTPLLTPILGTVDGLVTDVTGIVGGLVGDVDALINDNGLTGGVITIEGLDELNDTLAALDNIDEALVDALDDVLVYEDDITVVQGDNGEFTITFSDGLGERLEGVVRGVVLPLVNQLLAQVDALNVIVDLSNVDDGVLSTLVGESGILQPVLDIIGVIVPVDPIITTVEDILDELTNQLTIDANLILGPVKTLLKETIQPVVDTLTQDILDLVEELVAIQVLGSTTVELNDVTIKKPSGLNGDVKVYGAVINDSVIDLPLLSSLVDYDTITFSEKAPITPTPTTTTPTTTTTTTTTTGGSTLPNTSTDMWVYGLTGISTMMAGIGTRYLGRRRK
ncbi:LPXTG cell wall anchor domain-containing protein [Bacillus sp. DNRA2]|uniref:adhesive domain-containing protein n=1 Tax=Bacillus sp. DNRA2 TaxID=2723053 RepID=UPI00145ECD7D|nr:adhesive domain-containing protein [Bacillus sp. DNRA2]NMD68915.1 LPXTG cell wall anchor domain-containing protein [Bacillus sp. DNRA2]